MSSSLYKAIIDSLLKVESGKSDLCCVCLKNPGPDAGAIEDEVYLYLNSGTELTKRLSYILKYLMGEIFLDISTVLKRICPDCVDAAIASCVFKLNALENAEILFGAVDNILNSVEPIPDSISNYKSLYIVIDHNNKSHSFTKRYFDKNVKHTNRSTVLNRIKTLISKQDKDLKKIRYEKDYVSGKKTVKTQKICDITTNIDESDINATDDSNDNINDENESNSNNDSLKGLESDIVEDETQFVDPEAFITQIVYLTEYKKSDKNLPTVEKDNEEAVDQNVYEINALETDTEMTVTENNTEKDKIEKHSHIIASNLNHYKCTECNTSFNNQEELEKHMLSKSERSVYICDECGYTTAFRNKLIVHINSKHTDKAFVCELCDEAFVSKAHLLQHKVTHSDVEEFFCNECGSGYTSKRYLINHMRRHKKVENKMYKCRFCHENFKSKLNRLQHTKQHHVEEMLEGKTAKVSSDKTNQIKEERKLFVCDVCGKEFRTKHYFQLHLDAHAGKGHSCTTCNKVFKTKINLKNHMNLHTGETPYACSYCDKKFHGPGTRDKHVVRNHVARTPSHTCDVCQKQFTLREHLNYHKRKWHRPNIPDQAKFPCKECDHRAYSKINLEQHVTNKHKGETPFVCEVCGKNYGTDSLLRTHKKIHNDNRNYTCEICGKVFKTTLGLRLHKGTNHDGEKKVRCDFCEESFITQNQKDRHLKKYHGSELFECNMCPKTFKTQKNLDKHLDAHERGEVLGTSRRRHPCDQCTYLATSTRELKEHITYKHKGERPFACETCGKSFGTAILLRSHKTIHKDNRNYSCNMCEKVFKTPSGLRLHMHNHIGERKVKCDFCEESFFTYGQKDKHLERCHSSELFPCNMCPKKFKTQQNLDKHLDAHERGEILGKSRRPCDQCTHVAYNRMELIEHINYKHNGEKPFTCEHCGKSFGVKRYLKIHMLTHLNRSFDCNMCEKVFKSAQGLRVHMHAHQGVTPYGCRACERKFHDATRRLEHERKDHPDMFPVVPKPRRKARRSRAKYPCHLCDTSHPTKKELQQHINFKHLGVRSFECHTCRKSFGTERTLRAHERTHDGDSKRVCPDCGLAFKSWSAARNHMRSHSGEKPYSCQHCGKMFKESIGRLEHIRRSHLFEEYKCDLCDKLFRTRRDMLSHRRRRHFRNKGGKNKNDRGRRDDTNTEAESDESSNNVIVELL